MSRPIETYREALSRLTANAFRTYGAASFASIPADPERDCDLLLGAAISELERLRNDKAKLLLERASCLETNRNYERQGERLNALLEAARKAREALQGLAPGYESPHAPSCESPDGSESPCKCWVRTVLDPALFALDAVLPKSEVKP